MTILTAEASRYAVVQQQIKPPPFIDSIAQLRELNDAISNFYSCYDDLHIHIDSIREAIVSKTHDITSVPSAVSVSMQEQSTSFESVLEGLCRTMCSRGLRKYMATHLSQLSRIREQVPRALKLAPNPAKLVLDCFGKFYLQGSRAFARDSPMIASREVSILVLECFLLMMGLNGKDNEVLVIDKSVREEAEAAVLAWRKRMVAEGGVYKASKVDARGLLLFVACFGIPSLFTNVEIRDLVETAKAKEIVGVLQNSRELMNKIPVDIINLVESQVGINHERLDFPVVKTQTKGIMESNRSIQQEKPLDHSPEGYTTTTTKKRKSPPHAYQALISVKSSNMCLRGIEHDQPVSKHARIDSPSSTLSSKKERQQIPEQDLSLPKDYLFKEDLSLRRSLLEETILGKDSDFVDFYLLNLIEYMLGKSLDRGSNILQWKLDDERIKLHMLQDELVKKKKLEEEVIRLKTQLEDSKKENTKFQDELVRKKELAEEVIRLKSQLQDSKKENMKLGIKVESLIERRDRLLEKHIHDVEHARLECLSQFLSSVEWEKVIEDAKEKYLTIFRDSEEYQDELTRKAAIFYAKGFDVCRQQVFNSQRLPSSFDLSFLDVRADEMGQLPEEYKAPSTERNI